MAAADSPISEHTLRRRVFFYECDGAGIVHFSNYFRYMEEAEHGLWRASGLSIANREAGVGFPRVAAGFDFHRALRFEDEFDIAIRIAAIEEKTIRYTCLLTRDDERIATGTLTIICVTRRPGQPMKAQAIPPDIAARFEVASDES